MMQKKQFASGIAAAFLCSTVSAGALDERLADTESRLAALESALSANSGQSERIKINGFLTWSAARTSVIRNEAGEKLTFQSWDTQWNHARNTLAGIQFDAALSDDARAVVQFVSRGLDDFSAEAEWAYLSYQVSDDLTARAGRMVSPFYMHSQYIRVGYAYPWVETPLEVYQLVPMNTHEGVDLTWRTRTGSVSHDLNVFLSGMDVQSGDELYVVRDMFGINLRSSVGNWTTWLGYNQGDVSLDLSPLVPVLGQDFSVRHETASFLSAGVQYDNGQLLLMAESNQLSLDTAADWFPDLEGSYVTLGYRFGKLMPHLTWARVDHTSMSDVQDPVAMSLYMGQASRHEAWTLGVRYDLVPGIALKADVSTYDDLGEGRKQVAGFFGNPRPADPMMPDALPDGGTPAVFRLAVDVVF